MSELAFYATRNDLLRLLTDVEAQTAIAYVRGGSYSAMHYAHLETASEIPDVGSADADSSAACTSYMIIDASTRLELRHVEGDPGVASRYELDQLYNPDTVVLTPGGRRGDALIAGRVATAEARTPFARATMRAFARALERQFERARAFHVGPEALALLSRGLRLTAALQSPPEYDLAVE
jgi:hypothetical protein